MRSTEGGELGELDVLLPLGAAHLPRKPVSTETGVGLVASSVEMSTSGVGPSRVETEAMVVQAEEG